MQRVTFSLPESLYQRMEESRGDVSRSRWLVRLLETNLGTTQTGANLPAESRADPKQIAERLGLPTASQMAKRGVKPIPKR